RLLQPARDRFVVGVDLYLSFRQLALHEQGMTGARRAPQHSPVAHPVGLGLAAVGAESNEGNLACHKHFDRIPGRCQGRLPDETYWHIIRLTRRAAETY